MSRREQAVTWHTFGAVPVLTSVPTSLVAAGDPGSTRLVYAIIAGLVLIGVVLLLLGVWLVRQTRVDLPVLAPLERMGDRDWRRQTDPGTQRRILDEVRPDGAEPLGTKVPSPPSLDAEFELADRPITSMSDLAPPVPDTRASTPAGLPRPDLLGDLLDDPIPDPVDGSPETAER